MLHEFLSGKYVFVSLQTGNGKSLCYWVLPGALRKTSDSIVLVVSLLISYVTWIEYMKDATPEALLTDNKWRDVLASQVYQHHLMAVVIDEAHCG